MSTQPPPLLFPRPEVAGSPLRLPAPSKARRAAATSSRTSTCKRPRDAVAGRRGGGAPETGAKILLRPDRGRRLTP
eukprot:13153899-Alexandrium_andersonii.AAC.1